MTYISNGPVVLVVYEAHSFCEFLAYSMGVVKEWV